MAIRTETNQLDIFQLLQPLNPKSIQKKFTFVDLFAGIGGVRIPLEQLGGTCLGYSEVDKNAIQVYQQNFIKNKESDKIDLGDIQAVGKLPFTVDLMVGGVPCQPWSIAGKLKGLEDSRGKLWLDVFRLVKVNQPKAFIFENVKGLLEPRNRSSLEYIFKNFTESGYIVKYQVLNSYDFGLPQDRDRIFIVGIQDKLENCWGFTFPKPLNHKVKLYDVISGLEPYELKKAKFPPEVLYSTGKVPPSRGRFQKPDELNDFFTFADIRDGHSTIHSWDLIPTTPREKLICQTLLKNRRKKIYGSKDGNPLTFEQLQGLLPDLKVSELNQLIDKGVLKNKENKGYKFANSKISSGINGVCKIYLPHGDAVGTLTATGVRDYVATVPFKCQNPIAYKQDFIKNIYSPRNYKPLTAQDYAKLQGFPDNFQLFSNENKAKYQFGNAVSVPVVYHLAKEVLPFI
ncbi:DNA (cytosine-5-)-methyltransferase [Spirulina sp. CS-785/01]|uniref:DNA cytosine methyltransferase n=1 Tax=Spirulina sp. CS-785/01 TaxID=3021716 RepID=UPI00233092B9|nr:DNA (cytosine-5-)-methyltransferase [Spirulina sp. CS-785/01]MDB9313729.1 DNA (cytosine-5-)-methyltransferase [Spirulina sp. CS-785/01]